MPLIALVDGVRTVSVDLSPEEWDLLSGRRKARKAVVTLIGCEQPGFLRRSKTGLPHFVHKAAGDCTSHEPETAEHRAAKSVAYLAVRESGWSGDVEVPSRAGAHPDWIADVLATRGQVRVAIEIQWTRQDHDEFLRRQERYAADGVRAVWFARHTAHLPSAADWALPIFPLVQGDDGSFLTTVGSCTLGLGEAVRALLCGRIQFREMLTAREQPQRIVNVYEYDCYRCGKNCTIWHDTGEQFTSHCGEVVEEHRGFALWDDDRPEADRDTAQRVRKAITDSGSLPRAAVVSQRYSRTIGDRYMAFSCPHCSALFGDWHVRNDLMSMAYDDPALCVQVPTMTVSRPGAHWCLNVGTGNC